MQWFDELLLDGILIEVYNNRLFNEDVYWLVGELYWLVGELLLKLHIVSQGYGVYSSANHCMRQLEL